MSDSNGGTIQTPPTNFFQSSLTNIKGSLSNNISNTTSNISTFMKDPITNARDALAIYSDKTIIFSLLGLIFLFFILLIYTLTTNFTHAKSNEEAIAAMVSSLFFLIFITIVCVSFLPNFENIRLLFQQISSVVYIIIYVLFLIIFFSFMSKSVIDLYAYILLPFMILFGCLLFYKSISSSFVENFNPKFERIKTMMIFFSFIAILVLYYINDPGGYISLYFGQISIITIAIVILSFIYLFVTLLLPDRDKTPDLLTKTKSSNFFSNFSKINTFGLTMFVGFIISIVLLFIINPNEILYDGGIFQTSPSAKNSKQTLNQKKAATSALICGIVLSICILSSIVIGLKLFPEVRQNNFDFGKINVNTNFKKRIMLVCLGITILVLVLYLMWSNLSDLKEKYGPAVFVLNAIILMIVLGLIYKTVKVRLPTRNVKMNAVLSLFENLIFYIPCLLTDAIDSTNGSVIGETYRNTSTGSIVALGVTITALIIYLAGPTLVNYVIMEKGQQLVHNSVYTNKSHKLGNTLELNQTTNMVFTYSISFWVFIDALSPNTGTAYSTDTSVLNYGDNPNVTYNAKTNTFKIYSYVIPNTDTGSSSQTTSDNNDYKTNVVYENTNFPLQKWNNIVLNYTDGFLDIFLNGELVKSVKNIMKSKHSIENLVVGQDNGILGGICNVVYFNHNLSYPQIKYLYEDLKNKSPPILANTNKTIDPAKKFKNSKPTIVKSIITNVENTLNIGNKDKPPTVLLDDGKKYPQESSVPF